MTPNYSKATLNNMSSSYKRVFSVTEKELKQKEHQTHMKQALLDVVRYKGQFPEESKELADIRRASEQEAMDGKPNSVAGHFKKLYPLEFRNKSNWDIIYMMYTRMSSLSVQEPVESNVEDTAEPVQSSDSDINNNSTVVLQDETKSVEERKNKTMSNTLEEVRNKVSQGETKVTGSNVKTSDTLKSAARQSVAANEAALKTVTATTVIDKLVLAGHPLSERLVEKKDPTGIIGKDNLDRVWKKFVKVSGYNEETDTFENIVAGEEDNARKTMELIKASFNDDTYRIPINISESNGTVKGATVTQGDTTSPKTKDDLRDFMFTDTLGQLLTSVPGSFVSLEAGALASKSKKKKKASDTLVDITAVDDINALVVIKFQNRKAMIEAGKVLYWKELTPESEQSSGAKSKQGFKYKTTNKEGQPSTLTYKIPLQAEMFKTEVPKDLVECFGESHNVTNRTPVDLNNTTQYADQLKKFAELRAIVANSSVDNAIANDIRTSAAKMHEAADKETEEEFE